MTAEDVATDIEASGLATTIHKALTSAYEQGEAFAQGKADALVARYDDAYAEWRITAEGYGEVSAEASAAYHVYYVTCRELAPALVELVRSPDS